MSYDPTRRDALRDSHRALRWFGAMAGAFALLAAEAAGQETQRPFDYDAAFAQDPVDGSYGYFRTLDGSATLIQAGGGERIRVEVNEPILVGDRVFLAGGSRAELVLADRNLLRIGDEAELGFRALAYSGDRDDPASILDLERGALQLVVDRDQLGREYPSVLTPNATVQVREPGAYFIVVDDERRTEVVVRSGRADVLTEDDGAEVRPGEAVFVEGGRRSSLRFAAAPSLDRLEAWGRDLDRYGDADYADYVDSDLHYEAASLRGHGSWVDAGGYYAWRPYVDAGWAPYRHGRWRYTPSGLFWVSYEPWGWVPYHYGYWDYHSTYGWIWCPGRRFATAHVYWYWGPHYAGWIPAGYYARHYGHHYGRRFGFYFGVYGHIGGAFANYHYWSFLPHARLGHHRQYRYTLHGYDLGRRGRALDRGYLLTDTRSLRPDVWRRPGEAMAGLRRVATRDGRDLPDATAFVERVPRLPERLERVTLTGRDGRGNAGVRAGGGAVRADRRTIESQGRVEPRLRGADGRAPRLDGRSLPRAGADRARPEREARPTGVRPTETRPTGALRRPSPRGAEPEVRAGARRETPRVDGRRAPVQRPAVRAPSGGSERRTLRRPDPSSAASAETRARPSARSGPAVSPRTSGRSTARPQVRRDDGGDTRPSARPSAPTSRSRPSARPSGGSGSRPSARPSSSSRGSRPSARPSGGSGSRPSARPDNSGRSRPAGRSSGGRRGSSGN